MLSSIGRIRVLGVGTGSTVARFIEFLRGSSLGSLEVVASSLDTALKLANTGLRPIDPSVVDAIDVYIDGADEVDPNGNLLKGRGGALLGEKNLAYASRINVFIVGEDKLVDKLGSKRPLPVEVLRDYLSSTLRALRSKWPQTAPRTDGGKDGPVISDWGGVIVDVPTGPMSDPWEVEAWIKRVPGVVETGLFLGYADYIVVGLRQCGWKIVRVERRQGIHVGR